jgi:hypothetical protein
MKTEVRTPSVWLFGCFVGTKIDVDNEIKIFKILTAAWLLCVE